MELYGNLHGLHLCNNRITTSSYKIIWLLTMSMAYGHVHVCGAVIQNHECSVQVPIQFHYVLRRQEKADWLVETMPPYTSSLVSYVIVLRYLCMGTTTTNSKPCPWNTIRSNTSPKSSKLSPSIYFPRMKLKFARRGRAWFKARAQKAPGLQLPKGEWRAQKSITEW